MALSSRVISVFSSKGGVGKSLIATNLAVTLRVHLKRKVAFLVSLGSSREEAAILLGSSGVRVVSEDVDKDSLASVLADLRQTCDDIFIDLGSTVNELVACAFEQSNLILLVTTPDAVALNRTKQAIELFESLNVPLRMVKVVLNRAESRGSLRSAQVREYLSVDVIGEIPSDGRMASLSINKGLPIVMIEEGGRIKDSVRRLGRMLIQRPELFVEHFKLDYTKVPVSAPALASLSAPGGVKESLPPAKEAEDPITSLKRRVRSRLVERFDLKRLDISAFVLGDTNPAAARQLRDRVGKVALELLVEEGGFVTEADRRSQLVKEIVDEAIGLGPLEDLMLDEEISDILVNGKDSLYIEKHGKLMLMDRKFSSDEQVLTVIERITAPLGRRVDESNPMVDARLPDGSRVNAVIPPLSLRGPILSIRKFARVRYTMDDLISFGTLNPSMAEFLSICVRARKNMIVSGGTGSGKTTVLNILSAFIPKGERIVTIEDAAELQLNQEHWVPLEARPPNIEGKGQVTIRQLFRNALRMRPDRIVIGECRGDETLDMLQAMNTGHDGSLTTLHANSPQDVISRLDSLVLMSNVDLPVRAIREQVASAIHLIVHTERLIDGSRKITHITEITGMDEHASLIFQDLFVFRQVGLRPTGEVLGSFQPTGQRPTFLEELRANRLLADESLFRA